MALKISGIIYQGVFLFYAIPTESTKTLLF